PWSPAILLRRGRETDAQLLEMLASKIQAAVLQFGPVRTGKHPIVGSVEELAKIRETVHLLECISQRNSRCEFLVLVNAKGNRLQPAHRAEISLQLLVPGIKPAWLIARVVESEEAGVGRAEPGGLKGPGRGSDPFQFGSDELLGPCWRGGLQTIA